MKLAIHPDKESASRAVAAEAARLIRRSIEERGAANVLFATGASQVMILARLRAEPLDWSRVTGFHLDEYMGLTAGHPATFRRYLTDHLTAHVPLSAFHFIDPEADPDEECRRLAALLERHPIDLAFAGIGENGHLAFNEPPADFTTRRPFLVVDLAEKSRRQQLEQGFFPTLDEVPRRAITMSIPQICESRAILCSAFGRRKAAAVEQVVDGPVRPEVPASILQRHPDATLHLDEAAAERLVRIGSY